MALGNVEGAVEETTRADNSPAVVSAVDKAESTFDEVFNAPESSVPEAESPSPQADAQDVKSDPAQDSGSTPPAASPGSSTPELSEAAKNFLAKFNGDINAAAEAWWETNNRAAEMSKKLKEKEQVESPPQKPEPTLEAQATPELQRFDSRLGAIVQRFGDVKSQRDGAVEKIRSLDAEIKKLNRSILRDDPNTDLVAAKEKLAEMIDQRDQFESSLSSLDERLDVLTQQFEDTKYLRDKAAKDHELQLEVQRAREAEQKERETREVEAASRSLDEGISTAATEEKIPTDLHEDFREFAVAQAAIYLNATNPDGSPRFINDMVAFMKSAAKKFVATLDKHHRAKSAEYSQLKAQDSKVDAPAKAVAPEAKRPRTVKEWDDLSESWELGV